MPVSTWVEVDLDRFAANLRAIRRHIGPAREVLLVAKADAYGHGAADMAAAAEREGVTQLGLSFFNVIPDFFRHPQSYEYPPLIRNRIDGHLSKGEFGYRGLPIESR